MSAQLIARAKVLLLLKPVLRYFIAIALLFLVSRIKRKNSKLCSTSSYQKSKRERHFSLFEKNCLRSLLYAISCGWTTLIHSLGLTALLTIDHVR